MRLIESYIKVIFLTLTNRVFSRKLPEITHGYGDVQAHAIMKGGFNVMQWLSCYRLRSYLLGISFKIHMKMGYKVMCKTRNIIVVDY